MVLFVSSLPDSFKIRKPNFVLDFGQGYNWMPTKLIISLPSGWKIDKINVKPGDALEKEGKHIRTAFLASFIMDVYWTWWLDHHLV